MIKVCHVTSAHNRYDGRIFLKQCVSLANNDYDVTLLCCDTLPDEKKNNVNIVSVNKKFNSIYDRIIKSRKILKHKCIEIDADIYQFHDPDLLSLALFMKKRGKMVIFDSHEDYPALFLEREWIPTFLRKLFAKIYETFEKRVFKKLDGIICVEDYQRDRIKKINSNVTIITNYPIIDKELGNRKINNKKINLCFAGGVRSDWNHLTVIKAIESIDNVKYVVAGGYNNSYLDLLKTNKGFDKVEFLGKIDKTEIKKLYTNSNIAMALCSYRPNTSYKKGSLGITKIFEYMMYELPVIFTDFEVFKEILKEGVYGIAVNPYNADEVKDAIKYLIDNPDVAVKMGKTGRKLVQKKYNWDTQVPLLLDMYRKIWCSYEK